MSAQKLGAVGLMLLGVWWVAGALVAVPQELAWILRMDPTQRDWTWLIVTAASLLLGFLVVRHASRLARWLLPPDHIEKGPAHEELLPMALAVAAICLALQNILAVIRLLLPFVFAEENAHEGILRPWVELTTVVAAVVLFWQSSRISRWWVGSQPKATSV